MKAKLQCAESTVSHLRLRGICLHLGEDVNDFDWILQDDYV